MTAPEHKDSRTCEELEGPLALWAGGDLPGDDAPEVFVHLAGCSACAATLARLRLTLARARSTARAVEAEELGPDDLDVLQARVEGVLSRRGRLAKFVSRPRSGWIPSLAVAAAVGLFLFAVVGKATSDRGGALFTPAEGGARVALAEGTPQDETQEPANSNAFADGDEPAAEEHTKIELLTQDPKIKIIWLARR
jgi:hypothetical protein